MSNPQLRLAIPSKGRLKDQAVDLLKRSGLKFRVAGRQLFANCRDTGVLIILCHAQDIPKLVDQGVVDLGITGSDLITEKQANVIEHFRLGYGKCRLSVAVHKDSGIDTVADLKGKILGTKFNRLAAKFFAEKEIDVQLIEIQGAVEVMVLLGLVDGIVEIVETGSSLREHDLVEIAEVVSAEAVLVGNPTPRNADLRDRLLRRFEGVLIASRYSMLEYNCPVEHIDQARSIAPGYSSPTIQKTGDDAWLAVKVMVAKRNVHQIMDQLESIGCRAIIETEVSHCRL